MVSTSGAKADDRPYRRALNEQANRYGAVSHEPLARGYRQGWLLTAWALDSKGRDRLVEAWSLSEDESVLVQEYHRTEPLP